MRSLIVFLLGFENSDNGLKCITPCGENGLYEERYWCNTNNKWDYCEPKSTGDIFKSINFVQIYKRNFSMREWIEYY